MKYEKINKQINMMIKQIKNKQIKINKNERKLSHNKNKKN